MTELEDWPTTPNCAKLEHKIKKFTEERTEESEEKSSSNERQDKAEECNTHASSKVEHTNVPEVEGLEIATVSKNVCGFHFTRQALPPGPKIYNNSNLLGIALSVADEEDLPHNPLSEALVQHRGLVHYLPLHVRVVLVRLQAGSLVK